MDFNAKRPIETWDRKEIGNSETLKTFDWNVIVKMNGDGMRVPLVFKFSRISPNF